MQGTREGKCYVADSGKLDESILTNVFGGYSEPDTNKRLPYCCYVQDKHRCYQNPLCFIDSEDGIDYKWVMLIRLAKKAFRLGSYLPVVDSAA